MAGKNLNDSQIEKLDAAASNYYLKNALHYLAEAHRLQVVDQEAKDKKHSAELQQLIEKSQAESKIQPFLTCKPYDLYRLRQTWKPEHGLTNIQTAYDSDLSLVTENEEIINKNTEIIDNVVKMLEIVGLQKITYKYLRSNSKTRTSVTSEWYTELISKCANKYNTQGYSQREHANAFSHLRELYNAHVKKSLQDKEEETQRQLEEIALKKALQKEAILVAHACFKYSFNPLEVTNRQILDQKLEEKGLIPSQILQDIEFELKDLETQTNK